MPTFTPRTYEHPMTPEDRKPSDTLWSRMTVSWSYALLKEDGFYREVQWPTAEEVEAADVAYIGGHTYDVTDDEAAALTAAGYEVTS